MTPIELEAYDAMMKDRDKWTEIAERREHEIERMRITPQRLADALVESGVIHAHAIDDKQGYDNYRTWDRITRAADILSNERNAAGLWAVEPAATMRCVDEVQKERPNIGDIVHVEKYGITHGWVTGYEQCDDDSCVVAKDGEEWVCHKRDITLANTEISGGGARSTGGIESK